MDLALAQVEVDAVVSDDRPQSRGYASELECEGILDQGYVNSSVMTSALKKVDVAVFETAKDVQDGSFKAGTDTIFDVKSGGVGIGKVSPAGQPFEADVKKVQDQISSGEITDIPTEVSK
jgi:basic membrane protein A